MFDGKEFIVVKSRDKQFEILERFIEVYCSAHHGKDKKNLCEDCNELLEYARSRLEKCPYDPKPKCKDCKTHCYKPEYREKIKSIMHFSGMHFVKRGRIDWLIKYSLR